MVAQIRNVILDYDVSIYKIFQFISTCLLMTGLVYQSTGTLREFLSYPTGIDIGLEGTETLRFPGISICLTNWVDRQKLCNKYPLFCNMSDDRIEELKDFISKQAKIGEIAADASQVVQTTFEDPLLYYYKFVYDERQIQQTFSRLPTHICYTLDWRGNPDMVSYHIYPPLFEFNMFITWRLDRIIVMDEFTVDMGLHSVESLNAGGVHTIIMHPNGHYEFTTEHKVTRSLPPPFATDCANYQEMNQSRFYPAYMTQSLCLHECRRNVTLIVCGCTPVDYPFRNKLDDKVCDQETTASCVQSKSKQRYNVECPKICRNPCLEDRYETILGYMGHEQTNPMDGVYFVNVLVNLSRYVDVLQAVSKLSASSAMAIFGGYLGIWLGLSIYGILDFIIDFVITRWIRHVSLFAKVIILCIKRHLRVIGFIACAGMCMHQAMHDIRIYLNHPTSVQYTSQRMKNLKVPAFTVCMERGYNLTLLCQDKSYMDCEGMDAQRILGAYIDEIQELYHYAFHPSKVIYHCRVVSSDPICGDFDCVDMWKATYMHSQETVCWTLDLLIATNSSHPIQSCPVPWKYRIHTSVAAHVTDEAQKRPFMTGLLHDAGMISAGMKTTMKFRAGRKYRIVAFQTNIKSLPKPYETNCMDYAALTRKLNYPGNIIIQPDECCERCVMDFWDKHCSCISKFYGLRHLLKTKMCDIFNHVQCISMMKDDKWREKCLKLCSRPCVEIKYRAVPQDIGGLTLNRSRHNEVSFEIMLGSDITKTVLAYPRLEELISTVEGHIGLWLGVSILAISSVIINVLEGVLQLYGTDV